MRRPMQEQGRQPVAKSDGFTLVELLVVIAIIGVLVALLLPAVQQAREAARRMSCSNNLKQIGLAMHNYHDTYNILPLPGLHYRDSYPNASSTSSAHSWAVLLLPFVEQSGLHDMYDFTLAGSNRGFRDNPMNCVVGTTELPGYKCPSDSGRKVGFHRTSSWALPDGSRAYLARGNYGINCGAGNGVSRTDYRIRQSRGPFHFGGTSAAYSATFAEIRDGLSNTVLLGEVIAGETDRDIRGVWAYSTGMWISGGEPSYRDDRILLRPNGNALDDRQKDRPGTCGHAADIDRHLRCEDGGSRGFQTARSYHPGGVMTCNADGSVKFVAETIDLQNWLISLAAASNQVSQN